MAGQKNLSHQNLVSKLVANPVLNASRKERRPPGRTDPVPGIEQSQEDAPAVGRRRSGDVRGRHGVGPRGDGQVEEAAEPRHAPRRGRHGGTVRGGGGVCEIVDPNIMEHSSQRDSIH